MTSKPWFPDGCSADERVSVARIISENGWTDAICVTRFTVADSDAFARSAFQNATRIAYLLNQEERDAIVAKIPAEVSTVEWSDRPLIVRILDTIWYSQWNDRNPEWDCLRHDTNVHQTTHGTTCPFTLLWQDLHELRALAADGRTVSIGPL